MNAIAFSLFGSAPMYLAGAVANARLAREIFPGWQVWLWHDGKVPKATLQLLRKLGVKLVRGPESIANGMFWRFLIADQPDVERFLVRDCDSRLSKREAKAVAEWIESEQPLHVIRDHPHHNVPIMGGMWGGVASWFGRGMEKMIVASGMAKNTYKRETCFALDQIFLAKHFWNGHEDDWCQHDFCCGWRGARPFPAALGDWRFVGEIFDADGEPRAEHWQQRINWMSAPA